jgi:ADP-ribose pyrophosphatase YjhB (NUDIX family)
MSASLFRHCSRCGSGDMAVAGPREVVCDACGYRHFLTPIPAACALVLDPDHRLLLCRRAHHPGLGKWGLPGGVIEPNETAESAAARELREETGLDVPAAAFRYLTSLNNDYLFQDFIWPTLDLCYVARITEPTPVVNGDPAEVSELAWTSLDDAPLEEFAFESNVEAVRLLRAWSHSRDFGLVTGGAACG